MKPPLTTTLLSILASTLAAACASAPSRPTTIARGDTAAIETFTKHYAEWALDEFDVPGMSVTVVADGQILFSEGYGLADRERGLPVTPDTVFRVGSISKLATAMAVMKLVDRGLVDLDAPVTEYLADFSIRSVDDDPAPITVRHILAHHAGLPSDMLAGKQADAPEPLSRLLERLKDEYRIAPPATMTIYSNVGYGVLTALVEAVTGEPFADWVDREILAPMGMADSSFAAGSDPAKRLAKGYIAGEPFEPMHFRNVGTGELVSTPANLGRWMICLLEEGACGEEPVISKEAFAEMTRRQNADLALDFDIASGLGPDLSDFVISSPEAGPQIWHTGATNAFVASMVVFPEHDFGVAVTANSQDAFPIFQKVTGEVSRAMLTMRAEIDSPTVLDPGDRIDLDLDRYAKYAGIYDTEAGVARVIVDGDRLKMELAGKRLRLVPRERGFTLRIMVMGFIPYDLDGQIFDLETVDGIDVISTGINPGHPDDRRLFGTRIAPSPPSEAWRSRTGRYEQDTSAEPMRFFDHLALKRWEDTLVVEAGMSRVLGMIPTFTLALDPIDDERAIVAGLGRERGYVVKVERRGDEEVLVLSGLEFRRIE